MKIHIFDYLRYSLISFQIIDKMLTQNFFEQFIKRFHYFNAFEKFRKIINNLNFFISEKFSKFVIKEMLFSIAIYCIKLLVHYEHEFQTLNHIFDINYFDNK